MNNSVDNTVDLSLSLTTDAITEGSRLYYSDDRALNAVSSQKGVAYGLAGLDVNHKVPATNLPEAVTSKSITVEWPTNSEVIPWFFTSTAIQVLKIVATVLGDSPSITWSLRYGPAISGGTEMKINGVATTSNDVVISLNNSSIDANSFIWLTTTAKSGSVTSLHLTLIYK